ncbi:hypothetical protein NMY22_g16137 [Coprinellus aureogranulatus]|nr:hypothetical protein NMY22_g16137 [Coprinellus aureogranulatus]
MQQIAQAVGALVIFWVTYQWYTFLKARAKVDHIPTAGSNGFIGSYLGAWKYVFRGNKMVEEGYKKASSARTMKTATPADLGLPIQYKGAPFKVSTFETASRWLIVPQRSCIRCELTIRTALRSSAHTQQMLQLQNLLGEKAARGEWYHVDVTTKQITRNMAELMPDLMDEMRVAFEDLIPISEDWTTISATSTFVRMLCRMVNRFFFPTLQLHRNPEFLDLQTIYPIQVILSAMAVSQFPAFLRRPVARLISPVPGSMKKMKGIIGPLLEERLKKELELGSNYEGRPNDILSWFLETAPPEQLNEDDLLMRLMQLEFAAFHTSNVVIVDALLDIAARPEYVLPLREEAEQVTTDVGAVNRAAQWDSSIYENSHIFDGFRFVKENNDELSANGFVAQDTNFLLFSTGRHHWYGKPSTHLTLVLMTVFSPGRFLAAAELKAIICHILINYDMRLPDDSTTIPEGQFFNSSRGPSSSAKLQFRKRKT